MHGTEHHVEEAEHAKHASHDPFTQRVAMSMAIVAAILACVTLLSHRAHNGTLQNKTAAVDQWGYYQAKKNRQYNRDDLANHLEVMTSGFTGKDKEKAEKLLDKWKAKSKNWKEDANNIQMQARQLDAEAEKFHHQANFFDLGELGVELALVLCSIAVLTRQKGFWYSGLLVCAIGLGVALYGFTVTGHGSHGPEHAADAHQSEGTPKGDKGHGKDAQHPSSEQKAPKGH